MSSPRFRIRRPGARAVRPRGAQGSEINQALIEALVPGFARMAASAGQHAPTARPNVPSSAAPEKCRLEMPASNFRSWKHSMDWWLKLNKWSAADAVGHIRLSCTPELQRALDARYSVLQWSMLAPHDAIEAIKQITVKPVNKAAEWDKFFSNKQGIRRIF